jgi:hypothetical protein
MTQAPYFGNFGEGSTPLHSKENIFPTLLFWSMAAALIALAVALYFRSLRHKNEHPKVATPLPFPIHLD